MSGKTWLAALALTLPPVLAGGLEGAPRKLSPGAFRAIPCPAPLNADRCGYVSVPLDHARPGGKQIEVFVAVKEAFSTPKQPDPVFFLPGGPGVSAGGLVYFISGQFALDRDVVGIDHRGSGYSRPTLDCPEGSAAALVACRARQTAQGYDWRFFNSVQAAQDVEAVRRALGLGKINLYGASYGTLWAQEVLRRFPGSLRSAVLTGVIPSELNYVEELVPGLEDLARRLMRACAEEEKCNTQYPQLLARFEGGFTRLPARTRSELVSTVNGMGGDARNLGAVLGAFHAALSGEALPSLKSVQPAEPPSTNGLNLAVNCQEQFAFTTLARVQAAHRRAPLFAGAYDYAPIFKLCEALKLPPVNAAFHQPVRASVPTLLLTGEFDSRTPPIWLQRFEPLPPHWQSAVVGGQAHRAEWYPCGTGLLRAFLDRPTARLDFNCADQGRVLLR